ncbi:amidohydrolase family protein [Paenibacillus koleovorans]|uniref:amidohydrolase family protein n=1 Tax=Paenibacillus koleovorans TaxID=121608 RepID=UPI000FDB1EB3|nr:amidohydrolase family protein [Paenibacillus koleovorans]
MKRNSKVIDCDVHNALSSHMDLLPYLEEPWRSRVAGSGLGLLYSGYYSPIGVGRKDASPPGGGAPGTDPDFVIQQLIDPYKMEYAILTSNLFQLSVGHEPDFAAAACSAYNDYLIDTWLRRDSRFRGSILVATQDPLLAAREIDRVGPHPGMVQVIMSSATRMPLGQRFYHPIYEAAARHNLPVALHPGAEGAGQANPPTAVGYPSWYIEWHTCLSQTFMAQLVSLVCEGVFEKFPTLRFVLVEGGVAWLPHLMWRLDKNYMALRAQVPWLKRLPSEYIRDHVFLTTQPIEEPNQPKHLRSIFEMIDAEHILLYSSDYPHWDFDSPDPILGWLSPEARHRIFYENARQLYNLPVRGEEWP